MPNISSENRTVCAGNRNVLIKLRSRQFKGPTQMGIRARLVVAGALAAMEDHGEGKWKSLGCATPPGLESPTFEWRCAICMDSSPYPRRGHNC